MKLIQSSERKGIVSALNRGIEASRGVYIARMDSDDVADPSRIDKQVAFMERHSEVGACGTNTISIDSSGKVQGIPSWKVGQSQPPLEWTLFWETPLSHPTVMIRKSILEDHKIRYRDFPSEDSELWCQIASVSKLARLPDVLLKYRVTSTSLFHSGMKRSVESALSHSIALASRISGTSVPDVHRLGTVYSQDLGDSMSLTDLRSLLDWKSQLLHASHNYWCWSPEETQSAIEYSFQRVADRMEFRNSMKWTEKMVAIRLLLRWGNPSLIQSLLRLPYIGIFRWIHRIRSRIVKLLWRFPIPGSRRNGLGT